MTETFSVAELVPHSGKMSLLDEIVDLGEGWLRAAVHITEQSMFVEEQGVSAIIGIEYLAQGIAAYAGSQQRAKDQAPKLGFLLGVRSYQSSTDYFPIGAKLIIDVQLEMQADNGLNVFRCGLKGEGIAASARLNVFQPDNAEAFLQGV